MNQENIESGNTGMPRPKNWLVESILVTILCCLPFGIVGIVNAAKVDSQYNSGNYEAAKHASNQAGKWTKIGFFIGLSGVLLYVLLVALGIAGSIIGSQA